MSANDGFEHMHAGLADAFTRLSAEEGKRFVTVFEHESLVVELYAPRQADNQTPHTRDEVYIVVQGSGEFVTGRSHHRFGPGDFIFVPAEVEHRFQNFTGDLVVWAIFYGPDGGESPRNRLGSGQ